LNPKPAFWVNKLEPIFNNFVTKVELIAESRGLAGGRIVR